jgi:hypothetical protein
MVNVLIIFALHSFVSSMTVEPQENYAVWFTLQSAGIDTAVRPIWQTEFPEEEIGVLKSFSFDLDGDGANEQFICNEHLCGSGGCIWIVYSERQKKTLGIIEGAIIYIHKEQKNQYPQIETFWKLGKGEALVYVYRFGNSGYERVKRIRLSEPQIEQYFLNKPPLESEGKK